VEHRQLGEGRRGLCRGQRLSAIFTSRVWGSPGRFARRLIVLALLAAPASATAAAPYMGVDTWYAFHSAIDERKVVDLTDAVASSGLKAAGYRYVWLDAGWWTGARDLAGNIVVDAGQWPHGLAWLADYIHSKGLRAGIYTDVGNAACDNGGSLGHFQRDVDAFAAWGFDAVKGDFCGAFRLTLPPRKVFTSFADAIANDVPRRPMILNVCNANTWSSIYSRTAYASWSYAPAIAASWRTGTDLSYPKGLTWAHVLRNIDADARHPGAAGHGRWNDPDYLTPTYLPPAEARAQFTMWVILAAPLMVSADVGQLPHPMIAMLTNRHAIAIGQDPLGVQGRPVAEHGAVQVWVKPLADGSKAVALLNRGSRPATETVSGAAIGLGSGRLTVRHIWTGRTARVARIRATVSGRSAMLLRVRATRG
jgi:alpha-galactosidase